MMFSSYNSIKFYALVISLPFVFNNISPEVVINGDYNVVGLFSICSGNHIGLFNRSAVFLHIALKLRLQISKKEYKRVGYVSFDICDNETLAAEVALTLLLDERFKEPGLLMHKHPCCVRRSNIIAVVTYASDKISKLLNSILLTNDLTLLSFSGAETFPELDNPYYIQGINLISREEQIQTVINHFNWTYVAIVHFTFDREKDTGKSERLWNYLNSHSFNLCLVYKLFVGLNETDLINLVEAIGADKFLDVLFLSGEGPGLTSFLQIFAEKNIPKNLMIDDGFKLELPFKDASNVGATKLYDWVWNRKDTIWNNNIHYPDKWMQALYRLSNSTNLYAIIDKSKELLDFNRAYVFGLLAVYSFFHGITPSPIPLKYMTKSSMEDSILILFADGNVEFRSDNITFKEKVWANHSTKAPVGECKVPICEPGLELLFTSINVETVWEREERWTCTKCIGNSIKPTKYGRCFECPEFTLSNEEHTICIDPYINVFFDLNSISGSIGLALSIFGSAFVISIMVTIFSRPKNKIVRSLDIKTAIVQLLLALCFFAGFPVLMLHKPTYLTCTARPFLTGIPFTAIVSLMYTKTQKLLSIFKSQVVITDRDKFKITFQQVFIIFLINLINLALLFVTMVRKPVEVYMKVLHDSLRRVSVCNTSVHTHVQVVYVFLLLVVCNIQGFRSRKLPSIYNEGMNIVYGSFITNLCFIVLFSLFYNQPNTIGETAVDFIVLTSSMLVLVVVLYLKKFYFIIFRSEEKTKKNIRMKMQMNFENNLDKK